MSQQRFFTGAAASLGVLALVHAAFTWPRYATRAFFGGGALVAFVGEAVVSNLGWLKHHIGPTVVGVPVYVLFGWAGTIYVAPRRPPRNRRLDGSRRHQGTRDDRRRTH
ncbi:hypothetical protein [Natrinema salaciae]|uniref:Uncharacterized protein n=1 Tax=Natrinema salaciae TaxID=1186196 RepID=A0A1H9M836_9EURY|nr:hypothetical protein [Natrinema salaciae]SER19629.1 hypothetical protein SAMN04489841_3236 [Natrinema salaciae]